MDEKAVRYRLARLASGARGRRAEKASSATPVAQAIAYSIGSKGTRGVNGLALYEWLVAEHGYAGSYKAVKRARRVPEATAAGAKARRVLRAEKERPPRIQIPWNQADYVRVTREELYDLVWSTPMVTASRRHGLSDNELRKICKKLGIPTAPSGYWAAARLPPAKEGWPTEAWLPPPTEQ